MQSPNYEILKPIQAWMERRGDPSEYDLREAPPLLRGRVTLQEDSVVLMEVFSVMYGEDTILVHFFTTIIPLENNREVEALSKVMDQWNLEAMAGGYSITADHPCLYHRHTVVLDAKLAETAGEQMVLDAAYVIVDELTRRLPDIIETIQNQAD